jgi:hypothetical protein
LFSHIPRYLHVFITRAAGAAQKRLNPELTT